MGLSVVSGQLSVVSGQLSVEGLMAIAVPGTDNDKQGLRATGY